MQQKKAVNLSLLQDWKDKTIGILGFGLEGLSTAQFLHKHGISVCILDAKQKDQIEQEYLTAAEQIGAKLILGKEYLENLSQFNIIVRSPGIQRNLEQLREAEMKGTVITSQTKLFFDLCPSPIIGVTGTKGKGTTSTLIYEMLKKAGEKVFIGGNVGVPPLTFLEDLQATSWVVLELSSFQLQDLHKSPHIAVMLMVTSEHLDYHKDISEYVDAKRNILRYQTDKDFAILNRDYIASNESDIYTDGKVYFVSRERETDNGCFKRGDAIWIRKNGNEKKVIDIKDILLPGGHNLENVCAAVMAANLAGVTREEMVAVLKLFKGLEHRLELVSEQKGVRYYDDSFSTTPETAVAAIEAFTEPEILILGGSSKNSDFTELGAVIRNAKNIKAIIGIGDEWEVIKSNIGNIDANILLVEGAKDMRTIVRAAAKIARPGDVVLLSPGCASFGMFKNYKDRGDQFKREVEDLLPHERMVN